MKLFASLFTLVVTTAALAQQPATVKPPMPATAATTTASTTKPVTKPTTKEPSEAYKEQLKKELLRRKVKTRKANQRKAALAKELSGPRIHVGPPGVLSDADFYHLQRAIKNSEANATPKPEVKKP